eukprot:m.30204 g.30204  ORF g.30204 m.30204 type:complete len:156 (-) comp9260_c0_seq3:1844-2311(-)
MDTSISKQLPTGWEQMWDPKEQRYFYIDHNSQTTTWIDPRESSEPTDTAEGRLPRGWQRAFDERVGEYYIDHNTWSTYLPEELPAILRLMKRRELLPITGVSDDARSHSSSSSHKAVGHGVYARSLQQGYDDASSSQTATTDTNSQAEDHGHLSE